MQNGDVYMCMPHVVMENCASQNVTPIVKEVTELQQM